MFNFFKRSSIAEWETELLINLFSKLDYRYSQYKKQIEEGILNMVRFGSNHKPNYVSFSYNKDIVNKYENSKASIFTLEGIKVFDIKTRAYIDFEIEIGYGLVIGYSTPSNKEFIFDTKKILIENVKQKFWTNSEYAKIEKILTPKELDHINSNDVYEVILNMAIYYHIVDLQDGDFIGIDEKKKVYKISHDPFKIKLIDNSLSEVLKDIDNYKY